jgi:hypothetical protein
MTLEIGKVVFIKIENFCFTDMSRDCEDKPQTGRKYLQKAYLIRDL